MEGQKKSPRFSNLAAKWSREKWFYILVLIMAFAHAFKYIVVDWPFVSLLIIGGLPIWLPTLLRNIESFEKTDKGWRLNLIEDRSGLSITQLLQGMSGSRSSLHSPTPDSPFTRLSPDARRVLKTLWSFQVSLFGEDSESRWGFGMPPAAPDYASFFLGANELHHLKYVIPNARDMVYLTDEGIELCRQNREALAREPLHYKAFHAVPNE
jgi:hypothetical protein